MRLFWIWQRRGLWCLMLMSVKTVWNLVSFSPTIDQVVKTTEALRENNFVFIETIELMMRAMQVERGKTRPQTLMTGHTGYITHARKILKPPASALVSESLQVMSLIQEAMPEVPVEEADFAMQPDSEEMAEESA